MDAPLFRRSACACRSTCLGWRDDPLDRCGLAYQPILRLQMAQAAAVDRGADARPDGRPQAAHLERRMCGLAARADRGGAFYHPRPDGGAGRARHQDRSACDIVILDNLGSHKGRRARRAIRAAVAHLIFLPAYSPDLNPIEQLFAKLKHLMRAAQPRTVEETWRKAIALIDIVSPSECSNYFANSGYASS